MFAAVPVYISAAASESEGNSPVFYIILAVGIGLVTFFSNRIAQRKSRKSLTAATDGLVDGYTAIIAPAPPFPDAIRRMRDLLAETTPEPRITRYTRGVVLADSTGLTISDEKNGTFLTIPAADIVSIEARMATIKPRGVIIPRRFPAALVKVRRSGAEAEIALVPIVGTYNKVTPVEAATFAAELSSRVGLTKPMTRSLEQLTAVADPAWDEVAAFLSEAAVDYTVVPADLTVRSAAIVGLQVTAESFLGALAWNCGAISIDHNWIRVLGAGTGRLPGAMLGDFADHDRGRQFEGVIVAFDVLGGLFAIHGAGLDVARGEVLYFAPDTLDWTPLGFGHRDLIYFFLAGGLEKFYADLRWSGWEDDTDALAADMGLAAYPPPSSAQGGTTMPVRRKPVPITELVGFQQDLAAQLSDAS